MLSWVMNESKKPNVIVLRGNHEQMMLDFYVNGDPTWTYGNNGSKETEPKMNAWFNEEAGLKEKVLNFLDSLPLYHRIKIKNKEYFICHAGINPKNSLDEQVADDLLWTRGFYKYYHGETTIVVGHTPVQSLDLPAKPIKVPSRNVYLIDTGSFFDEGRISCIDLVSGRVWRSDPKVKD